MIETPAYFLQKMTYDKALSAEFSNQIMALSDEKLILASTSILDTIGDWFFLCPGTHREISKNLHHNCLGGLAQHALGVHSLVCAMVRARESKHAIHLPLLAFLALFHDVGKCYEKGPLEITEHAHIGHVAIALEIIPKFLAEVSYPDEDIAFAKRILLSYYEGYPDTSKISSTLQESHILAHANILDIKLWSLEK